MRIGGFQKVSLIDFPGKVAAVIFTQGCNFRCSFCHNLKLVIPSCFSNLLDQDEILSFLESRVGKLQGIVITGGEPTLQEDLAQYLEKIKALGYEVKLDTNGSRPEVLQDLVDRSLIDYIAMDIKASDERYDEVSGVRVNLDHIHRSIEVIRSSGLDYQFRTTFPKPILGEQDLPGILSLIHHDEHFQLQPFVAQDDILDNTLLDKAHYEDEEFEHLKIIWQEKSQQCEC